MATEGWITIPGVGRRYRTGSGEIRNLPPNPLTPVRDFLGSFPGGVVDFFRTQDKADLVRRQNIAQYGTPYSPSGSYGRDTAPHLTGIQTGKYGPSDWQRTANPPTMRPRPDTTPPGPGPVPIVTGTRDGVNPDRSQSDQYLAAMGTQAPQYPSFPQTPQGQFDRYFGGSPEMDRYFGAASRGAGAPKTLQEMQNLASLDTRNASPANLAAYYRAQSAAGRGNMDTISSALTQNMSGIEAENMRQWANANPMLAERLYNKQFPGGASELAKLQVPVEKAFGAGQMTPGFAGAQSNLPSDTWAKDVAGSANPYQMPNLMQQAPASSGMDTSQLYGKGAPNLAAYTLPGGAMTQGTKVSAPFQQASSMAAQYMNPQNLTSQAPGTSVSDSDLQTRMRNFFASVGAR